MDGRRLTGACAHLGRSPVAGGRAAATILWLLLTVAFGPAVDAQEAPSSAVQASDDAFGTVLDLDAVGLYNDSDARGFSPLDAGNLRLEGLFFDMKTSQAAATDLDPCWVREASVRVGLAAQHFGFPAPTGIVDVRLASPEGGTFLGGEASRGPLQFGMALLRGRSAIADSLSVGACLAGYRNFAPDFYSEAHHLSGSLIGRWHAEGGDEVLPFVYVGDGGARGQHPRVYADGTTAPPWFDGASLPGEPFTEAGWRQLNAGLIWKTTLKRGLTMSAGLFHSREDDARYDVEQWLDLGAAGTAEHVLDVVPPQGSASTSGEILLVQALKSGSLEHELRMTLRARHATQRFGGDALVDYGPVTISAPLPWVQRPYQLAPTSLDETRQVGAGAEWVTERTDRWSASVGALRTRYVREVSGGDAAAGQSRVSPILVDARVSRTLGAGVEAYASYVQGLEDSALAPDSARNRGEPPAATRSWQVDAGARWQPDSHASLILGLYVVHKPYLAIDTAGYYRALGSVRHEGVEGSFVGDIGSCRSLAGAVWLRARRDDDPALPGDTPVGTTPVTSQLRLDCTPQAWNGWSLTLGASHWSRRPVSLDGRANLPVLVVIDGGLRYEGQVRGRAYSVRLDGQNLTNARGLHVSDVLRLSSEFGRRFTLRVTFDQ